MNIVENIGYGLMATLIAYSMLSLLTHHDVYQPIARHSLAYL